MNDTTEQQMLFIENINLIKLVHAIFKIPFVISFSRPQKRAKVMMITILNNLEPPILAVKLQIVLNIQNGIFEIRILSHSLKFFHFYLIYFNTHGISSPKNSPLPLHISPLKKAFEKCKPVSLFLRFCGALIVYVDSTNLQFYGTCNLTKVAIRCRDTFFYKKTIFFMSLNFLNIVLEIRLRFS